MLANPVGSTFKIKPECDHFSPPLLLPSSPEPSPSLTWIVAMAFYPTSLAFMAALPYPSPPQQPDDMLKSGHISSSLDFSCHTKHTPKFLQGLANNCVYWLSLPLRASTLLICHFSLCARLADLAMLWAQQTCFLYCLLLLSACFLCLEHSSPNNPHGWLYDFFKGLLKTHFLNKS